MTLEIDILNATVSALVPVSVTGIVVGIFKVAEFNEHKKTTEDWMIAATKKMDKHEENDQNRQREVMESLKEVEKNILDFYKKEAKS